jgi:hypothetical protein
VRIHLMGALHSPKVRIALVFVAAVIATLAFATMAGTCPGGSSAFPCQ